MPVRVCWARRWKQYADRVDLCIDHHVSNSDYARRTLLDAQAAAACEVMTSVIRHLGVPLTKPMADALFTGCATDTGCFRYSNTTANTLRTAADLIDAGADSARITNDLFETVSRKRMTLENRIMDTLEYHFDDRCATIVMSRALLDELGAKVEGSGGIVSIPRRIEGVDGGGLPGESLGHLQDLGADRRKGQCLCHLRELRRRRTCPGGGLQCARSAGTCQGTAAGSREKGTDRRMRDGIICIDKPAEHTSFDVIARVRGILHMEKKVGHAGTLDPMTTGVLPVFLGRATKACDILPVQDKRYRARFQLGVTTDTQDCTGTVLERREVRVSRKELIAAIRSFEGEQMQLPPMYSAIQVGGRRLYDIAREGGTVERTPRPVTFYSIEILIGEDWAEIDVHCSKGSYIRTLCHDIGEKLGCGAMLTQLRRTMAAGFTEADCLTLEQLTALAGRGQGR